MENLEIRISALKAQLSRLETAKAVDELTVADVYDANPEYRERVFEAIKNDEWGTLEEAAAADSKPAATQTQEKLNYL